jgi:tetratricopeptide (TPR) repeat protein
MNKTIFLFGWLGLMWVNVIAQTAESFYNEAQKYKTRDNYSETAKQLGKALELDPDNKQYQLERADALYRARQYFEAIPLYESLIQTNEPDVQQLARLAEMYSVSPQKMKGVEYAKKAMALEPADGETNKILARTFWEVEHYPKAIQLYQKAYSQLPDDKDIPLKLALGYTQIADYRNAEKYYLDWVSKDPENPTKLYEAAIGCQNSNNFTKAIELFERAENLGYQKSKMLFYNWGFSHEGLKEYKKAMDLYLQAKALAPYDRELNLSIADLHVTMQEYNKARDVLDELLEMNPNDAEVIYNKGMTYYKAGNTGKAESFFNRAFELDPSLKSLRYVKANF